jgi:type IV secretory pathway TraG/TraD family ATPase VirD4
MAEKNNDYQITPFAVTNYRDIKRAFGIKEKNRRGHMYIIGKTGTGKSTLMENMIVSDIRDGRGVAVIDPAGDLIEELLHFIPKERINDTIYFNPADIEHPIGINPLAKVHRDLHHLVASGIISVFKKTWQEFWGPRLEHILRNAVLALLDYPDSTLLDLPPMLTDKDFRQKVVTKIKNPEVRRFWVNEFAKYSAYLKSEATAPILNKVGQYLSTPILRNIFGQSERAFTFGEVINQRKILLVNLAKGKVGEDNCSMLGAMIITQLQLAAVHRTTITEANRIPFYLYVDEIHSFATSSFADILSEARKFGLCLTISHQYLGQLCDSIRTAIFGNVGTLISFRVGNEDAKQLAEEFTPDFNKTDLVNLSNHNICLKLLIDGVTSKAFSADTLPPPARSLSFKRSIIKRSREKYGKPRKKVEQEILLREGKKRQKTSKKQLRVQKLPL